MIKREKYILEKILISENSNLVKVYVIDEVKSELIIIMELCKGGDLKDYMEKYKFN
jgi:serine/threonine protein kinase